MSAPETQASLDFEAPAHEAEVGAVIVGERWKLPWFRMTLAQLIDEARRAIKLARIMVAQLRLDRSAGDAYAEVQHRRSYENAVHNVGFYRDAWKAARRLGVVLQRKPSGLALLRLACGCEVWVRRLPGDQIHRGRQARACGTGGACAARVSPLEGRLEAAAIALVERGS